MSFSPSHLDLALESVPRDGNSLFSSVARALRFGGKNHLPDGTLTTMQSVRHFLAGCISASNAGDLMDEGVKSGAEWIGAIETNASNETIIESLKLIVSSHRPVYYTGGTWSFETLRKALRLEFVILSEDGTLHCNHIDTNFGSDIGTDARIILLQRTKITSQKQSYVHFSVLRHEKRYIFSPSTIPLKVLAAIKHSQPPKTVIALQSKLHKMMEPVTRTKVQPNVKSSPIVVDDEDDIKIESQYPIMCTSPPKTPLSLYDFFILTLKSMDKRMEKSKEFSFVQKYELEYTMSEIELNVSIQALAKNMRVYECTIVVEDPLGGKGPPMINKASELKHIITWIKESLPGPNGLIQSRIKLPSKKDFISVDSIDEP